MRAPIRASFSSASARALAQLSPFQRQQAGNFFQAETELLGTLDEVHAANGFGRVASISLSRPRRLCQQAQLLVVTDGFDIDAACRGDLSDGESFHGNDLYW